MDNIQIKLEKLAEESLVKELEDSKKDPTIPEEDRKLYSKLARRLFDELIPTISKQVAKDFETLEDYAVHSLFGEVLDITAKLGDEVINHCVKCTKYPTCSSKAKVIYDEFVAEGLLPARENNTEKVN